LDVVQDEMERSLGLAERREALGKAFSGPKKADSEKQVTGEWAAAMTPLTSSHADRIHTPVLTEQAGTGAEISPVISSPVQKVI